MLIWRFPSWDYIIESNCINSDIWRPRKDKGHTETSDVREGSQHDEVNGFFFFFSHKGRLHKSHLRITATLLLCHNGYKMRMSCQEACR